MLFTSCWVTYSADPSAFGNPLPSLEDSNVLLKIEAGFKQYHSPQISSDEVSASFWQSLEDR